MLRYTLALDLKDDPALIERYEAHHRAVPAEVIESIRASGIRSMQIFRTGNRLFMVIEADETFSFERKGELDANNPAVQAWERLMDEMQQRLPWAREGEKWVLMEEVFGWEG